MPQIIFTQDNGVNRPRKIFDCPKGALVMIEVLDNASTLFFDTSRETLESDGLGAATPNNKQGFQLQHNNAGSQAMLQFWLKGSLWARSDTAGGLINASILFDLGAGAAPPPEPQFEENI